MRTNATYGSHAEAHAIATSQGFQTNIFEVRGGVLRLLTQVGTANPRAMSLLWVREEQHYKVLNGGAGLDGQAYAPGLIVHDPVGDGNCMYEAMYYIQLEGGDGGLGGLLGNAQYRAARVGFMRQTAANNLDDDLANILGEELQAHGEEDDIPIDMIYKISLLYPVVISKVNAAYPPKTYYIRREKNSLAFYGRADKAKKTKDMDALLRDDFAVKNKEDRKIVLSVMEKDRSYFPDEKKKSDEDVVEYPFPSIAPKVVYRWCSTADAKAALAGGIIKGGGIHDGIPTVPNLITKEFARSGGGVGIACADKCLEINLSLIPEIAKKQPNSLRKTPAKGGVEYKILVTIPAAAIRDITSTLKK